MAIIHLATRAGLFDLDPTGTVVGRDFEGREVVSVAARYGRLVAAVDGLGVLRRTEGAWEQLGLGRETIWTVGVAGDGTAYAGVEPAAIWRLRAPGDAIELEGLGTVEGADEWHSPWGPADLSSIFVDEPRLVVGIEVGGVAVSHDGGVTWEERSAGLYEDVHRVVGDGPMLWATTGLGCYRSTDEGRSWEWESEGMDRGYTQGLARSGGAVLVSAASGPPPMWEAGGPEAALYRAEGHAEHLRWSLVAEGYEGNVGRQSLAAEGDLVAAGTEAGELLLSHDGGVHFDVAASGFPPVTAVAIGE